MTTITQAINTVLKEWDDNMEDFDELTGREINEFGLDGEFFEAVKGLYPQVNANFMGGFEDCYFAGIDPHEHKDLCYAITTNDCMSLCFIELEGRYYDAETPDGVDRIWDLPYIQRGLHEIAKKADSKVSQEYINAVLKDIK